MAGYGLWAMGYGMPTPESSAMVAPTTLPSLVGGLLSAWLANARGGRCFLFIRAGLGLLVLIVCAVACLMEHVHHT